MKRKSEEITAEKPEENENLETETEIKEEKEKENFKHFIVIKNFGRLSGNSKIRSKLSEITPKLIGYRNKFRKGVKRTKLTIKLYFHTNEDCVKSMPILKDFKPNWNMIIDKEDIHSRKKRKISRSGRGEIKGNTVKKKTVEEAVTPLYQMEYSQQLNLKKSQMIKKNKKFFLIVLEGPNRYFGEYLGIKQSPVIEGYRNHVEFTCGVNENGENDVGFLLGSFALDYTCVGSPDNCKNVSEHFRMVGRRMKVLIDKSKILTYSKVTKKGFWRLLKIKENVDNDILMQIQVNSAQMNDEQFNEICKNIVVHFIDEWNVSDFVVVGILIQKFEGVANKATPESSETKVIYGKDFIIEKLFDLKFKISNESFFQVNTKGAEVLYGIVKDWLPKKNSKEKTLLFDICCGTGTIGQLLSKHVDHVVGIDFSQSCINDAIVNKKMNGISNVEYIVGRVENVISEVIKEKNNDFNRFIAVVDPPRSGLVSKVLVALRNNKKIEDIIYVSCNPNTLFQNALALCKNPSNRYHMKPYTPQKLITVDMFPHCNHMENVMLLKRDLTQKSKEEIDISSLNTSNLFGK